MVDIKTTTLVARQEKTGRVYPIFLERIVLVLALITFVVGFSEVSELTGDTWVSVIATWCLFPCALLFITEIIGRLIQRIFRN